MSAILCQQCHRGCGDHERLCKSCKDALLEGLLGAIADYRSEYRSAVPDFTLRNRARGRIFDLAEELEKGKDR